jgi:predicted RNase H-like nuclease
MTTAKTADGFTLYIDLTDRGWAIADATRVQHRGYVTAEIVALVKANAEAFDLAEIPALVKSAKAEAKLDRVDHNRLRARAAGVKPARKERRHAADCPCCRFTYGRGMIFPAPKYA